MMASVHVGPCRTKLWTRTKIKKVRDCSVEFEIHFNCSLQPFLSHCNRWIQSVLRPTMPRCCAQCNRWLNKSSYSRNQWSKGEGLSRCHSCVHPPPQKSGFDPNQTARRNNAHNATFQTYDLDNPFASGTFRWVAKGKYTDGSRAGQACVCKWFKSGGVLESHFYAKDLETVQASIRIITKWNREKFVNRIVKINQPEVWTFKQDCTGGWAGRKVLQEPYIEGYQKFNSNTGWADDSLPWPRVMQAISHFSYHTTNGTELLCDLQGGVYQDGVILTDPAMMSLSRCYGPTDLGLKGIHTFFANHVCNEFCRSSWLKVRNPARYYNATKRTSMEHVPTRRSRPMMSGMGSIYE